MDIRVLTLEEILYYGALGEVSIISESEWDVFQDKLTKYIEDIKSKGGECDCDLDLEYNEGYRAGLEDAEDNK